MLDKEQHLNVELQLLQQAYTQTSNANLNVGLLPCSSLLLAHPEFNLFTDALTNAKTKHSFAYSLTSKEKNRYASATQIENLKQLSLNGYSIGLNNFAKDKCELNLLSEIDFDYLLLSSTFSKRILQQASYDLQLQGVLAITKIKNTKVIAKGPAILNFQSSIR